MPATAERAARAQLPKAVWRFGALRQVEDVLHRHAAAPPQIIAAKDQRVGQG